MERINPLRLTRDELQRIADLKSYIISNLKENLTMKVLMQRSGLNRHKVNEGFRRLVGKKPRTFILKARMEHARYLLLNTEHHIRHIAGAVGYRHKENFRLAYKRYFGITPGAEQKNAMEE